MKPARLLTAVLVLLFATLARAQDLPGKVAVDALPALGSQTTYPGWVPVQVTLRNDSGEDLRVRARLVVHARWPPNDESALIIDREEQLAPKVEKRFFLYAYVTNGSQELSLRVERPDGTPLAKPIPFGALTVQDPQPTGYGNEPVLRLGAVSRKHGAAMSALKTRLASNRYSSSGPTAGGLDLDVVLIEPASLPDRRIGYAPLDALLLHDVDLEALSPEQRDAIKEWTVGGGRLIISPGADASWLAQPFFEDLLPPGKPVSSTRTSY